jgi:SAM-dependent methyltransferase
MMSRATQAELLEQRIAENRQAQQIDLVDWIFERARIEPSDQILELCCGTGGQTLRMLSSVGTGGRVVGLDTSAAALETLSGKAGSEGSGKLVTVQAGLDELTAALEREGFIAPAFNMIFCAYGLYYSKNPRVTLSDAVLSSSGAFMVETVVPWAALHFESVRISTMVNPVRWATPERVLNYWQNTTFYDAARKPAFESLLARHFSERGEFVNEKWVMMVEMQNARA